MSQRITKLQRWLDLIAYLTGRRLPVPVEELMERIPAYARKWQAGDETSRATARRMFERDKDELRRAGVPLRTVAYSVHFGLDQVEGYQITRRDFYLPYLRLVRQATPSPASRHAPPARVEELQIGGENARTALEALRRVARLPSFPLAREARAAFRKLAFDLSPEAFPPVPVLFVDRRGADELSDRLRLVSEALLARKRLRFRYHGVHRGEATERDVAPYGLLFQQGHWYLIGHDDARADVRVFRVGRMDDVVVNPKSPHTPDFPVPTGFRLQDYADREPWELGGDAPLIAHVLFRYPRSLWAARNRYGAAVEERADGSAVRRFDVHQTQPFLRWLLGQAGEAQPTGPPELVAEFRALARETAALYQAGA